MEQEWHQQEHQGYHQHQDAFERGTASLFGGSVICSIIAHPDGIVKEGASGGVLPEDVRREHLHKLRHRGLLMHGIPCQLAQVRAIDMPRPVDDGADVPLDGAPVALLLLRQGNEYALLDAQEAVFVVEHHPYRLDGDVVAQILPADAEGAKIRGDDSRLHVRDAPTIILIVQNEDL